jgi:HSP20 family protein
MWQPFRDFEEFQERTMELLQAAAGDTEAAPAWTPLVDIEELEDAWLLEAELPGADADHVNVQVDDNDVRVDGEIVERERKGILRRRVRRTGAFSFRVTLPGDVDPEGVDASLDNGVLTIRVPKAEGARPRRVAVTDRSGSRSAGGDAPTEGGGES